MICTTSGSIARSPVRFASRSGFTLIELVLALVVVMILLGGWVRALEEAESVDEFMRGDDIVRVARSMVMIKVLENVAVLTEPETASDDGEAHPEEAAALPQENGDIVVLPDSGIVGENAATPR